MAATKFQSVSDVNFKVLYKAIDVYLRMPLYGAGSMACSNNIRHVMFVAEICHKISKLINLMAFVFSAVRKK